MKSTKLIMGMPITAEIADKASENIFNKIFEYFTYIDETFSTYKDTSEISKINRHKLAPENFSPQMAEIFELSEQTKRETGGYFDIKTPQGTYDPSGLVKGWAIYKAAEILKREGYKNFFIEAGGDIQASGKNLQKQLWCVGLRNPFNNQEIIKVIHIEGQGVATSGSYERGRHIYNPNSAEKILADDIVSLTVVGPNVYQADRFATAAFAMGKKGIEFIERREGLEGYMIDKDGMATLTSGFGQYTHNPDLAFKSV